MINRPHNSACPVESASWRRSGALPREAFRRSGGFSLVEIMIVTSVVTIGFISVLSLIRNAIIVYYNNQNYLTAATITQQGLEIARYIRDDNWLAGVTFSTNLSKTPTDGFTTILAIDQQAMVDPTNENREKIKRFYDSIDGDLLVNLPGTGNLNTYIKDNRAKVYFDTNTADGHDFYTTRATLTTTDKMPPNGDGHVITDLFNDTPGRYKPTIFNNLIQTTYHTNGTANKEDDYIYVVSTVYWQDRGADKYFSLATYLYDYSWKY